MAGVLNFPSYPHRRVLPVHLCPNWTNSALDMVWSHDEAPGTTWHLAAHVVRNSDFPPNFGLS